jgi:hypothetical protein
MFKYFLRLLCLSITTLGFLTPAFPLSREEQQLKDLQQAAKQIDAREQERRVDKIENQIYGLRDPSRIAEEAGSSFNLFLWLFLMLVIGYFGLDFIKHRRMMKQIQSEIDLKARNNHASEPSPLQPIVKKVAPRSENLPSAARSTELFIKFDMQSEDGSAIEDPVEYGYIFLGAANKEGKILKSYGIVEASELFAMSYSEEDSSFGDIDLSFGTDELIINLEDNAIDPTVAHLIVYVRRATRTLKDGQRVKKIRVQTSCNGSEGPITSHEFDVDQGSNGDIFIQAGYFMRTNTHHWKFIHTTKCIEFPDSNFQSFTNKQDILYNFENGFGDLPRNSGNAGNQ